jgi:hypothetical protein
MKISQLNLLPVLFDALCDTAPNAHLRNDRLGKRFLFFRGPLFQIICFFVRCAYMAIVTAAIFKGDVPF